MAYTVRVVPSAFKGLSRLPAKVREKICRKIDLLGENPYPQGAVKLAGAKGNFFRVRVGDYRVIYRVRDDVLIVLVVGIGHRREIYQRL
jgi:mRNA interferase RelE/StbE